MAYNLDTFLVIGAVCAGGVAFFNMVESFHTPTKPKKTTKSTKPIGGTKKNKSRK